MYLRVLTILLCLYFVLVFLLIFCNNEPHFIYYFLLKRVYHLYFKLLSINWILSVITIINAKLGLSYLFKYKSFI